MVWELEQIKTRLDQLGLADNSLNTFGKSIGVRRLAGPDWYGRAKDSGADTVMLAGKGGEDLYLTAERQLSRRVNFIMSSIPSLRIPVRWKIAGPAVPNFLIVIETSMALSGRGCAACRMCNSFRQPHRYEE